MSDLKSLGLKPHLCHFLMILNKLFNLFDPHCCHQPNTSAAFVKLNEMALCKVVKHHANGIYYLAFSVGGVRGC